MKRVRLEALNAALIVAAILSAGMGLKGFLLSSNFIDGGVTGVSMLLAKITTAPLALWLPLVNAPFIAIGYRQMGAAFAARSALAIAGLSAALATIQFPDVTPDLLLTAVFGGFFIGAGIGVSPQSAAIRERITGELERGVTVYKGYGGLSGAEQEILYCVVTRLEIGKVKSIVRALDENAFVVSHVLADAEGGVVKRAPLH